jgi:hypothetical protein
MFLICLNVYSNVNKKEDFNKIRVEVKSNLIKMFSIRTNMIASGYTNDLLYDNVADICSKYLYLNKNTPFIYIDPQIITIKDGKISLTQVRKLVIGWKHPYQAGNLLVLNADVKANLDNPNLNKEKKVFRGVYFLGGLNFFDSGTELKNYASIGICVSWFNLFGFSFDTSIMYNSYLTGGVGIGYTFKNMPFGVSVGMSIGNDKPAYYFGIKCKLF